MSTAKNQVNGVTTPSDAIVGRIDTPEEMDSNIPTKRNRPSLLSSVGKIFSRTKKKGPRRVATPRSVLHNDQDDVALTDVEKKYRQVSETSTDRAIRVVLSSLHFGEELVDVLVIQRTDSSS